MANAKGKVTQVIGAVVDVQFEDASARDSERVDHRQQRQKADP